MAAPYGVVIAVLYLKGYWDTFDVNALQYVSLSDLLSAAIFPMVVFVALMPLAALIGTAAGGWLRSLHKTSDAVGTSSTANAEREPKNVRNGRLIAVCSAPCVLLAFFFIPAPIKWAFIALFSAMAVAPIVNNALFERLVPNTHVRLVLLLLTVSTPILVYYRGSIDATRSTEAKRERVVDVARSKLPVSTHGKVLYLGLLGDTHFLLERDSGSVILLAKSDDQLIVFTPSKAPNPIVGLPFRGKGGAHIPTAPVPQHEDKGSSK
ncbi:hypothetical protein [Lysobacter sp. Root494]|uniref:hypothetical protein n=1 Tax=Lysobacter sp. Root494 TaxID=1736549 RepID=UPI0006F6E12F|nr:hypothetical protein [Lysobacter sp. Root494]KQY54987.1 hypothetical protein ASD14_02165 [Lysobacter sp. Root494]